MLKYQFDGIEGEPRTDFRIYFMKVEGFMKLRVSPGYLRG